MAATYTLSGNPKTLLGSEDFERVRAYVTCDQPILTDPDSGEVRIIGEADLILSTADTTLFSVSLPGNGWTPSPHFYTIHVEGRSRTTGTNRVVTTQPFQMTSNMTLANLPQAAPKAITVEDYAAFDTKIEGAAFQAQSSTIAAETAAAAATAAQAAAELAELISGISTPDGVVTALINSLSSTTRAALISLIETLTYDSGWVTVDYPGTTETWTRPDGSASIVPVFQNSWYHHDPAFPVQFRRMGLQTYWRGWMKRTTGAETDPVATTIPAGEVAIKDLAFLLPTTRNQEFILPAGSFGAASTSVLIGLNGGVYTMRYASGSGSIVALDSVRHFVDN